MAKGKHQILKGHKRVKSRFIPPLMQIGKIQETSYINDLLPHVVWMSLLIESLGLRRGIDACLNLAKLAHTQHTSEKHVNFAICGNHAKLVESERTAVLKTLQDSGELSTFRDALAPLIYLHPSCPMSYLGLPENFPESTTLVKRLADAVEVIFDRFCANASIVQANVLVARMTTGGLFIAEHIGIPDFDAMIKHPDSEAGKRAASFARTSSMQEFMPDEAQEYVNWPKAFWQRNYRLDSCCILEREDD